MSRNAILKRYRLLELILFFFLTKNACLLLKQLILSGFLFWKQVFTRKITSKIFEQANDQMISVSLWEFLARYLLKIILLLAKFDTRNEWKSRLLKFGQLLTMMEPLFQLIVLVVWLAKCCSHVANILFYLEVSTRLKKKMSRTQIYAPGFCQPLLKILII